MKNVVLLSLSAAALLSAHSYAEEEKPTQSEIELGYIATSGNTETSSAKGKINVKQDLNKFRNQFILEGLYKSDQVEVTENNITRTEEQVSAEKYFLSAKSELKINDEHMGLFGFGSYEEDKFSGYDYQSAIAVGFSDRLFNFDAGHFDYSVGPGVAINKTESTYDNNDVLIEAGEKTTSPILRASIDFLYEFSDNAKFTQVLSSDIGVSSGDNTKTKSESAISADIVGNLALKLAYIVDHNTHVVADKKHADTQTLMTLSYSF